MTLLGIDVSHHQGSVDFGAVKRAGYQFAFLKATEGTGFLDSLFAVNRLNARKAGLTVGAYHFARATSPVAEADYFCQTVGSLAPGDLVVLDWEVPGSAPATWCKAWLDRVAAKLGVKPLIYMNQTARDASDWSPVVSANYGLWLAMYDNSQAIPPSGRWPNVALKQFTDAGKVPGVPGGCDVNVFYGDAAALARFGYSNTPQQEDDMPLTDVDINKVADEVWTRLVTGSDGKKVPIGAAIQVLAINAANAARDAAVARKLAETAAAAGRALTVNEIDDIGTEVAHQLGAGFDVNLTPKPDAPPAA